MTIDIFRPICSSQRTCSTPRGVYRLTLSSYKRLLRLATSARSPSGFWTDDNRYIIHSELTF